MQEVLKDKALITRPNIRGEIKLTGLDESITVDEIQAAVAIEGACRKDEVKTGKIGRTRTGAGVIWVQCPKTAAVKLADLKRNQIG